MKDIEVYSIVVLIIVVLWLIFNTIAFSRGKKRIVKNLHRFAKEGEVISQNKLAKCYETGDVVPQNSKKAAFWYQKAAFGKDALAKKNLNTF